MRAKAIKRTLPDDAEASLLSTARDAFAARRPRSISPAGPSKKRTRIQQANEKRILDAALDVFATYGYRGATLDQVADKAGMSKPNLLYYFRTKKDIYLTLLNQTLETWVTPLRALDADGDPVEQLEGYILGKLEMSRTNPKASRLFANEILQGAPAIKTVLRGPLRVLVEEKAAIIQKWIDAGKLAPVDPIHLIFMIWAATQHYADFEVQIRAVLGSQTGRAAYFENARHNLPAVFLDGLRPRKG